MDEQTFPLNKAADGQKVRLIMINGGQRVKARLRDMGLSEGMIFKVLHAHRHGPCVIVVGATRLMIGRGMADIMMCTKEA